MIILLLLVITATAIVTRFANRQVVTPGYPSSLQYIAAGMWLLTVIMIVITICFYFNIQDIKPIGI